MIECELFRLHAFKSEHCVSSYRAAVLPPEFFEAFEGTKIGRKALVNETGGAPALSKRSSILVRKVMPSSVGDGSIHEDKGGNSTIQSLKNKHTQKLDGKVAKAIEKAEQNRKRRLERKAKVIVAIPIKSFHRRPQSHLNDIFTMMSMLNVLEIVISHEDNDQNVFVATFSCKCLLRTPWTHINKENFAARYSNFLS